MLLHADIQNFKFSDDRLQGLFIRLFETASCDIPCREADLRRNIDEQVLSICHLLMKHKANLSLKGLLLAAVRYGSLGCVKFFLEHGVSVSDCDDEENTALHHCFGVESKFSIASNIQYNYKRST